MSRLSHVLSVAAFLVVPSSGFAQETIGGLPKADAEQLIQNYLGIWSTNLSINPRSVSQFYAPRVTYYGKAFSRVAVLDDKLAYIRQWPQRDYREVPGSLTGTCNAAHTVCHVAFQMTWRRVSRTQAVSTGRARVSLEFVPVEGRRKIARESAQIL